MGPSNLVAVCLFPADNLAPNTPFPPANHQDPLKCGYRIQEIRFMKSPQTSWPSNIKHQTSFHIWPGLLPVSQSFCFHSNPFSPLTHVYFVENQQTLRHLDQLGKPAPQRSPSQGKPFLKIDKVSGSWSVYHWKIGPLMATMIATIFSSEGALYVILPFD